ncbi:MAG: hypothetical protein PVI03_07945 [Candidatus Thorarchaeota archaeon]|jgi:hypothetical protein
MKKIAEALVECGYADQFQSFKIMAGHGRSYRLAIESDYELLEPFDDTLEGRRQADALEDWLAQKHAELWGKSKTVIIDGKDEWKNEHQWRLDRIEWCFEQLEVSDGCS